MVKAGLDNRIWQMDWSFHMVTCVVLPCESSIFVMEEASPIDSIQF